MKITAVVITKNEESMIANCIETLRWCDEVYVIDNGSSDRTQEIASFAGANVIAYPNASIIDLRNKGLGAAQGDWIFYVDADERVTPALAKEIKTVMQVPSTVAYAVPRNNIHYGKWMQHGGWNTDSVVRLFKRSALQRWDGDIHEHAIVDGKVGSLFEPLVHITHRDLMSGLRKSIEWTPIEASLLFQANHPKMSSLRFLKIVITEFFSRFILKKGWKDGVEGCIESMVQAMNRFFVYEQLWEMQRSPSLEESYERIEKEVLEQWKKEKR